MESLDEVNVSGREFFRNMHSDIEAYYRAKLARYGAKPLGVDWACQATQCLRFVQLLKICDFTAPFSLNDVGCGYGALAGFLADRHPSAIVDYLGVDLCGAMVRRARRLHGGSDRHFAVGSASPRLADYSVASGIMNVSLGHSRTVWESLVASTLKELQRTSRLGFAVNFMADVRTTKASAALGDELYGTDPYPWIRYCERDLGCSVEMAPDYGMREFTLLVRCAEVAKVCNSHLGLLDA